MSEHLPDCIFDPKDAHGDPCICDRLRQAEQRTIDGFMSSMTLQVIKSGEFSHGFHQGVQAAREAVAALRGLQYDEESVVYKGAALFAIDALVEGEQ